MEEIKEHQETSKFRVNRDLINSVDRQNQDLELQELDITVYDHSTLERGIIDQVKDALDEKQLNEEEEGEIKDGEDNLNESQPKSPKSNDKSASKGTVKDAFSFLENYLKLQTELAAKKKIFRKRHSVELFICPDNTLNKKAFGGTENIVAHEIPKTEKSTKKRKKKNISPCKSKRRKSESDIVFDEECTNNEGDNSGSEYIPSNDDYSDDEYSPKDSRKKTVKEKNELISDESDSAWLSSEEEYVSLKKSKKELDDGHLDIFIKRTKSLAELDKRDCISLDANFRLPTYMWDKLFDYQRDGVKWLWQLHKDSLGGILGDEMGLGKTIQMISFLAGLHFSDEKDVEFDCHGLGPTIIVCPTTIMHQWVREFHTWYPQIRVAILHESGTFSGKSRKHLIKSISSKTRGILITSYSGLILNRNDIFNCPWHYVILDEGHKIRNPEAQITSICKSFDTSHKIILSGSPMQNNLKELWSLFDFIIPGKLGSINVFTASFVTPIVQGGYVNASKAQVLTAFKCATVLRDTIKPYLLRRSKMEVNIQLPGKKEQVLFCKLTDDQREAYLAFLRTLDVCYVQSNKGKLFGALVTLRKICNHPDLYTSDFHDRYVLRDTMFGPEKGNEDDYGYWKRSGKMIVLVNLLKHWAKIGGQKVLIFTQGKKMMSVLENFIKRSGYKYLKLDGGISIAARQPLIDKFNGDVSYFIMLLTTRVGGLGVNLTGANKVVIFDPDWNPATDAQARERAWRIGQTKDVSIYRLLTTGTIEEKMYHRQIFKEFLSNKILKDPKQRRFFKANDLMELFTLNETVDGGTSETAAIFAGTGSEIKYNPKASAKSTLKKQNNIFQSPEIVFSDKKLEEMRKIAQAMSKRIAELASKKKNISKQSSSKRKARTRSEDIYGPDGLLIAKKIENIQKNVIDDSSGECSSNVKEELAVSPDKDRENCHGNNLNIKIKINAGRSNSNPTIPCTSLASDENKKYLNNNEETLSKHSDSESDYEMTLADILNLNTKKEHKQADKKKENTSKVEKINTDVKFEDKVEEKVKIKTKHKKKHISSKKSKYAKFEGEVVPHLVKCRRVKKRKDEEDEEVYKNHDDYILHKLLKKSGIDTAMQHDAIMEESPSDYAIVEEEASRIADEAVKAIQQSYNQRRPEMQSKNPLMQEIMNKIKERNLQGFAGGPQSKVLLSELISYLNSMGGTASTNQIIENFSEKVDAGKSPIFRKLLSSIATFYRAPDSKGYWTVKDEFRSLIL